MSVRSVIAVLGGIVIISFLGQLLELPLVNAFAAEPIRDFDAYLAARSRPSMQVAQLGIAAVTGLLAGYLVAKVAGGYEMPHVGVAALLQTALLFRDFAAEDAAAARPIWLRVGLVSVTVSAMLLGGAVRARAARLTPSKEVGS